MKSYRPDSDHPAPDTLFILLLLCVFAFASFMLVTFGASAYSRITDQKELRFQRVTPLAYVASKVRQSDGPGAIHTEESEGVSALVIDSMDGGEPCETWIYEYDGALCELYIGADTPFDPGAGTAILKIDGFSSSLKDGVLTLRSGGGQTSALSLVPRGTDMGGDGLE